MKNYDLLKQQIESGLEYIKDQQEKTKPILDLLVAKLIAELQSGEGTISLKECFDMYCRLMEQQTNSILVITKMQEILNYTKDLKS